jgi:hypothetical protein
LSPLPSTAAIVEMSKFNQQLIDADVLQAGRISVSALLADPACGARSYTICRGSSCS